ncbi:hypothetical protein [Streptomyces chryseus]|uniref:hypothetical protein n=1 Tax=Streptomyces chryseus TaxID=68186 RepID=UPI00110FDA6B|nr:hypothetical protein [Streptomyces chryseus]GGX39988.1 hypothetical protein GCM10010353_64290 [Streptomyces chryseus]
MAKPLAVIGILTQPTPASWWRRNRHIVFLCVGLFLGYQLCGTSEAAHFPGRPDPAPSRTATETVRPLLPSDPKETPR